MYLFIIIFLILIFADKKKIPYYNAYISFFSFSLPLICFTFYGQIFGLLISILICDDTKGKSLIDPSLECHTGNWFYVDLVFGIICLCLLTCVSFITILVFYRPNFFLEENDVLKKTNSIPDLIFFINKIIYLIIFDFMRGNKYQWFILFVLFIFTFINTSCFFYYNNYENQILMKFNKGLSLSLFWSICCLIIGKIFYTWEFNGSLHLFFFGMVLILLFFIFHKEKMNEFYIIDFKQINSSKESLKYIKTLLNIIKYKDKCRKNFIIFHTFVLMKEENCINKNCKLKKYLTMAEKGYKSDFLLCQYCQQLFEIAIKKFPNDIILKSNYIIYLVIQMSKKKLAQKILSVIEPNFFNFQDNYIIFSCKKFIEGYMPGMKKNFEEYNKNIMKSVEYEKRYDLFKENLTKAASLYYEFWSSLYRSHIQGTEDFIKLNDIGEKVNDLTNNIHENFEILYNVKNDDLNVLNLYSLFLKNVLNCKTKYNNLKNIFSDLSNFDKFEEKEMDYSNFDIKELNKTDEYKYIIISAEEENLGVILNISLNACQIFGYNKNEIIGKKVDTLIPEIYHKHFEHYLMQYTNNIKSRFYYLLSNKREYFPEFLEMVIDTKNKSKYLIPLYIKSFLVQTEKSEHVYIVELLFEDSIIINKLNEYFNLNQLNSINSKEMKIFNYCYILTDCYFKIQTFTSNCQELLGLNSNALNGSIDITLFIEQFKEEVDKMIYEENMENEYSKYEKNDANLLNYAENFRNNHNSTYKTNFGPNHASTNKKLIYKRYIAENKYKELKLINWKIYELMQLLVGNKNNSNFSSSYRSYNAKQSNKYDKLDNVFNKKNIFYGNTKERQFLLVIKRAELNGMHVGYKFFLKREIVKCVENENGLNLENKKYNNNIKFNLNKSSYKKNSVSFKSFDINENEDNEEIIHNSKTQNLNLIKLSKSFKNKKKDGDKDDVDNTEKRRNSLHEDAKSVKMEEINVNLDIEKIGSTPIKKNIFKKKVSKFHSLNNIHSDLSTNKNILIVDQNFVPLSNFSFILDVESLSFKPLFKKNKIEKSILNILKNEAMTKIKYYQTIKTNQKKNKITFSSNESSYEDSESNEEDNSSSLESNISEEEYSKGKEHIKKDIKQDNKEEKHFIKEKTIKEEIEGHYYRVNGLNKIKFMLYDFEQEMVIDKGFKKDMKSEVENIITNYKLKIPIDMDKDLSDPSFKIKKYLLKYSHRELKKDKSSISSKNLTHIGNEQKTNFKELEIYKRIEDALYKNNNEKLILKIIIFIILSSLLLLVMGALILYLIMTNLEEIKNNILLIIYSTNLRHFTNMGLYYLGELLVLNMKGRYPYNSYINYPIKLNKTTYTENISESLKEAFFSGHHNMENMMGTPFTLSANNTYYLKNKRFTTQILYDDFKTKNITTSLSVCIVQLYLYLYQLIISENIILENYEAYNFMHNAINTVGMGIEDIIKIYLSELQIRKKKFIIIYIILISVTFVIHIFIYFLIRVTYLQIIRRKESYISIFYDISFNYIKSSMIKCEKFINKINPNELLIIQEKNDNFDDITSISNFEDNLEFKNVTKKNNNIKNNKINEQIEKKFQFKDISQNRIFKFKFFCLLLISFCFMLIIILMYITLMKNIEIAGFYIYYMQHFHNNLLNVFIAFREFIVNRDSEMHNMKILDFLSYAEKEVYRTFTPDIDYLGEHCDEINGLSKIFSQMQKHTLCSQDSGIELSSKGMCDYYMETITSLGFFVFVSFWIEEIRIKRNYILSIDKIVDKNLTFEERIIDLSNNLEVFPDVNYMFIHGIVSSINKERNAVIKTIKGFLYSKSINFIALILSYFIVIILLIFSFWRPIINNIRNLFIKTKNMFSIIPVEILASQTNIKNLLGVSDLND